MTSSRITGTAIAVFGAIWIAALVAAPQGQAPAQNAPATAQGQNQGENRDQSQAQQAGGRGGRGRGGFRRVDPAQQLYTEQCSDCHGVDLAGGRAPSLFDQKWLATVSDQEIVDGIENGVDNTEMEGFKGQLTDDQIWSLVQYVRNEAGNLTPKPAFVPDPSNKVVKSEVQTFKIDVVADGLQTPWGLSFLPDGRLLVTERDGRLRIIDKDGKLDPDPVKGTPKVWVRQDAGMLDVAVGPNYAQDGWIYLSYAEVVPGYTPPPPGAPAPTPPSRGFGRGGPPSPPSATVIVRGKLNAKNEWTDQQMLFRADPSLYTTSGAHYGSRFLFDKNGHVFFSLGERGDMTNAQKLTTPLGKIHRINLDGTIPSDNPFYNTPGAVKSIWSYGHRNPQGLAWGPETGLLWESEHGPNAGDEINIIEKGHDYGWGVVSMGRQPGITKQHAPGMDDPITYYIPTIAPSGIGFYTGDKYPNWKNNLFVCGLAGQQLRRLVIDGRKVTHQEVVFEQFGRVRDVTTGPDGLLYILLQNPTGAGTGLSLSASTPGRVVRLIPE